MSPTEVDRACTVVSEATDGKDTTAVAIIPDQVFNEGYASLPAGVPYEVWEPFARELLRVYRNIDWWVGDTLLYGEALYGELAYQVVGDLTTLKRKSLKNILAVARQFPPSRRREGLSFSHHAAACERSLPAETIDELLDAAESEGLTSHELYERKRALKGEVPIPTLTEAAEGDESPVSHEHEYVCRTCGEAKS